MTQQQSIDELKNFNENMSTLFQSKKEEITSASGGIVALQELLSQHTKLMEQVRAELQTSLSSSQITPDAANAALSIFGRSNRLIIEFLTNAKSRLDIKSGELMAYNFVLKQLEEKMVKTDQEEVAAQPQEEVAVVASPVQEQEVKTENVQDPVQTSATVVKQTRGRKRPDEAKGKLGETVKRIKQSRKKKTSG